MNNKPIHSAGAPQSSRRPGRFSWPFATVTLLLRALPKHARAQAAILVMLMLITGALEGLSIGALLPLLASLTSPETLTSGPLTVWLPALKNIEPRVLVAWILGFILFLFLVKNIFQALTIYLRTRFVLRHQAEASNRLLLRTLNRPLVDHLRTTSAAALRNCTQSVGQLFGGVLMPILALISEALTVAAILSILLWAEPLMTIATAALLVGPSALVAIALRDPLRRWGKFSHDLYERMLQAIQHPLALVREIKVIRAEDHFARVHLAVANSQARYAERQMFAQEIPRLIIEMSAIAAMLFIAGYAVLSDGSLARIFPTLGLFAAASFRLLPSANRITHQVNVLALNKAAFDEVIADLIAALDPDEATHDVLPRNRGFSSDAHIQHLTFRYPNQASPILDNVDLHLRKGVSIGIRGASGGGKTTLVNILLGLLRPESGSFSIDGNSVSYDEFSQLRVGYVAQDVVLIDDTIRSNVAFGVSKDKVDEVRVWASLEKAHLAAFVRAMPEGLETVIGERGSRLSGGQKQRVSIARALYHDPEILVFDEATSALDTDTEKAITEAVHDLRTDKAIVIVAHRETTLRLCDEVHIMRNGNLTSEFITRLM